MYSRPAVRFTAVDAGVDRQGGGVGVQHLDGDVVGAAVEVVLDAGHDGINRDRIGGVDRGLDAGLQLGTDGLVAQAVLLVLAVALHLALDVGHGVIFPASGRSTVSGWV